MGRVNPVKKSLSVAFIFFILLGVVPALVSAQQGPDKKDNRPERGIALYTEYSGVAVARGETVQMDLTLENKGRRDENIDVRIAAAAKGWKATLKGARYRVTGMVVTDGKAKTLALNLEPDKGIGPGKYAFQFEAQTAVDHLTLSVAPGEVFGFLGPNGAGKTTTMLMLLGLTEPTSGTVRVCGFDPTRDPLRVKEIIGYLPENVGFYEDMDARQNLRYIARLNDIPDPISAARIDRFLEEVDLAKEADKKVGSYSKGMRQRLGIAEVLIKEPKVVFLDEPTIGLDPDGTNRMLDLIQALSRERQMTIFFSSHLLDQVQQISDRIGIMIKGKLVAAGPLAELAQRGLGLEEGEAYTLEEIYMKYFKEA